MCVSRSALKKPEKESSASMSPSVNRAERQAPVQSTELPLMGAVRDRQAPINLADNRWILPLIGQAIDRTMQRKEAAILLGLDAGQMTRQLQGDGHLSVLRMGALPREFWIALVQELKAHYRLDDPAERVQQAVDLIGKGMAALIAETKR